MKIYISGPISGTDDYMERFAAAEQEIKAAGHTAVNPADMLYEYAKNHSYEEIIEECLKLEDGCNEIYMMRGWEESMGAVEEWEHARAINLYIRYQDTLPRHHPKDSARDALLEVLKASAGYFTAQFSYGHYTTALEAYAAAELIYRYAEEAGYLSRSDKNIIFGKQGFKEDNKTHSEGWFPRDKYLYCRDRG